MIKTILILIVYCSVITPHFTVLAKEKKVEKTIGTLSTKQLLQLENIALSGDSSAADKLSHYYSGLQNYAQQLYWLNIAAENGDLDAQYNYARMLLLQLDNMTGAKWKKRTLERAKFWLKKVVDVRYSDDALKLWREISEKYKATQIKLLKIRKMLTLPSNVVIKKQKSMPEYDVYHFTINGQFLMMASVDDDPLFPDNVFVGDRKLKIKKLKINDLEAKRVFWHKTPKLTSGEVILEVKEKTGLQYIHFYYEDLSSELEGLAQQIIFSAKQ